MALETRTYQPAPQHDIIIHIDPAEFRQHDMMAPRFPPGGNGISEGPVTIPGITDWQQDASGLDSPDIQEAMYLRAREAYTQVNPIPEAFRVDDSLQERIDRLAERAEVGQIIEEARQGVFDVYLNGEAEEITEAATETHDPQVADALEVINRYDRVYQPGYETPTDYPRLDPQLLAEVVTDVHTFANGAAPDVDPTLLRRTRTDYVVRHGGNGTPNVTERRGDNDGYHKTRRGRYHSEKVELEEAREREERYKRIGLPKDIEAAKAVVPAGMAEGRPVYLTLGEVGNSVAVPEPKKKSKQGRRGYGVIQNAGLQNMQTLVAESDPATNGNGITRKNGTTLWEDRAMRVSAAPAHRI